MTDLYTNAIKRVSLLKVIGFIHGNGGPRKAVIQANAELMNGRMIIVYAHSYTDETGWHRSNWSEQKPAIDEAL